MNSKVKGLRCASCLVMLLLVAGCGGLSMSKSVSPIDFFLPGLIQAAPPPVQTDPDLPAPADPPGKQMAKI